MADIIWGQSIEVIDRSRFIFELKGESPCNEYRYDQFELIEIKGEFVQALHGNDNDSMLAKSRLNVLLSGSLIDLYIRSRDPVSKSLLSAVFIVNQESYRFL